MSDITVRDIPQIVQATFRKCSPPKCRQNGYYDDMLQEARKTTVVLEQLPFLSTKEMLDISRRAAKHFWSDMGWKQTIHGWRRLEVPTAFREEDEEEDE